MNLHNASVIVSHWYVVVCAQWSWPTTSHTSSGTWPSTPSGRHSRASSTSSPRSDTSHSNTT